MEKRVISQEALIAASHYAKERDYWLEKFSGAGELTRSYFPYDYNGEAKSKRFDLPRKGLVKTRFTGKLFTRLMEVSNGFDYTLHMIAVAVTVVLLYKYTYGNSKDIIVGAPIYKKKENKDHVEFVNTVLALRERLKDNMTFKELLFQVRKTILEADKHKNYPLEVLISQLNMTMFAGGFPLFDVAVLLENIHDMDYLQPVNLNIIFSFLKTEESVELVVYFNPSKYEKTTVQRIVDKFTVLLQQVLFNLDLQLSNVEILTGEEKKQLLITFNDTEMEYPHDKTVHQLFAEQASRTPGGIAVVGREEGNEEPLQLTYRELNKRSDQLAGLLRKRGIGPDSIVPIMAVSSIEMVAGLLGILKAGGAFLPIDRYYPEERIKYMLTDSKAKILLAAPAVQVKVEIKDKKESIELIDISKDLSSSPLASTCQVNSAYLAYVIYTSGSTGRPKGVMIQHRSLVNLCCWHNRNFSVVSLDRAVKYAGFGFDASVWEIFPYILVGASLHILPDEIKLDVEKLNHYFEKHKITIAFLPTQICEQFMILENQSLRVLLTGGDKLNRHIPRNYRLVNNYGPTESSVVATSFEVKPDYLSIPIGKPTANVRVYVLNKNDHLQPIGVPGELCIGGDGLARGYLNQPELTAEKFDHDLWDFQDYQDSVSSVLSVTRNKIYKTGDLARWLSDGNIEFLGRIDHQVKIRGYRIELSEVEYQLQAHKSVKEAVVIARTGKREDKYLCAYFVPRSGEVVDIGALKQHLFARLPAYMVPQYMVQLEQIPLTPNGKIDRKALPEPENKDSGMEIIYVEPETDEEKIIATIWREVLNLEKVGINDNFFDLGGNSLGIIKVTRRLRETFKQDVPTAVIFLNPTINLLARYFNSKATGEESLQGQEEVDRSEVIDEGRSRLKNRLQRMEVGN